MSDELFSRRRPEGDDSGRVVVVDQRWQSIKLRSLPTWVGCHWLGQHLLCAGSTCEICKRRHPRRSFAFSIVDRPGATAALLRLSATDVATMSAATGRSDLDLLVGDAFKIRRDADRKPLSVEFLKNFPQTIELSQEYAILEVLRLHRIKATAADVRERAYYGLIAERALSACQGQKSLF